MVVSEAAYPGSIPGGRTSRKSAEHLVSQGIYDFARIDNQPDVQCAHTRDFMAKTSADEVGHVKELLGLTRV